MTKKNYRFDNRSPEEFEKQIKSRTLEERTLFLRWINSEEKRLGLTLKWTESGCGNHGEFLKESKVNTKADFHVEGYGPVETKFAKPLLDKNFHLKCAQVRSYLKQNAQILMVNGAETDQPQYTLINPDGLKRISDYCEKVTWHGFGGKQAYRIPVSMFIWRNLV
jgi:hypothetical protein